MNKYLFGIIKTFKRIQEMTVFQFHAVVNIDTIIPRANKCMMVILCILLISCSRDIEKEIHYIPNNYRGNIFIVHDVDSGANKMYLKGRRHYIIPKSGILYTKFEPNTGIIPDERFIEFYYVDTNNSIVKELDWNYCNSPDFISKNKNKIAVIANVMVKYGPKHVNRYIVDTANEELIKRNFYFDYELPDTVDLY